MRSRGRKRGARGGVEDRRRQEKAGGKGEGEGEREQGSREGESERKEGHYLHLPLMSMGVLVLLVTILGARSSEMSR